MPKIKLLGKLSSGVNFKVQALNSRVFNWVLRMKSKRRTISKKPAIVFSYYQYETIGCGGMIALKRSQARAVMVGFLTDEC